MKVAIIGSREYQNIRKIKETLFQLKQKFGDTLIIISGGAKDGADKFARKYALEFGIRYREFNPAHTIKNLYYPSINYEQFKKYNKNYYKKFKVNPNEITILTYDALGLIYFAWKKNGKINSINDFIFKNKIKGKIGTFSFKDKRVIQELDIYKTDENKFIKF